MDMKRTPKKPQNVGNQKDISKLLAEALKQPGIREAIDVFEASEQYSRQVAEFDCLSEQQRFPIFFNASHSAVCT